MNQQTGEVKNMIFRFKNKNYGKNGEVSSNEILAFEGEDMDADPNMFILKTKGGLVGSKR